MLIIRFASHMITETVQVFWAELQRGEFITDAAVAAGTYRKQGSRWVVANGGVRPRRGRDLKGRCVSFAEREEISLAHAQATRYGRSLPDWVEALPRSAVSWRGTASPVAATGPVRRTRWPITAHRGRNRRSWR